MATAGQQGKSESKIGPGVVSSFLIADPSSSRKSIRQLLSQMGMKPHQVDIAEGLGDTLDLLKSKKSQVIFVDRTLIGTKLGDLILLQEQSIPPGSAKAVFLLTSAGSPSEASGAADEDVDAVIVRPFTFQDLQERVQSVLEEKFFPKPHQQLINQARGLLRNEQLDEAYALFEKAKSLNPEVLSVYANLGTIRIKQKRFEEARKILNEGLQKQPTHYRCLLSMIELLTALKNYEEAYKHGRTLADNHPIPIKQLPMFIKLSVLNAKFEDMLAFYKLIEGIEGGVDEDVATNLAAGLAVCGLFCLRAGRAKDAIEIFKKAQRIDGSNLRILTRILRALGEANLKDEVEAIISRMPKELQDTREVKIAQLTTLRTSNPALALNTALGFLKSEKKELDVMRIAIQLSVEAKRSKKAVGELLELAMQHFPDHQQEWDGFRSSLEQLTEG